MPKSVADPDPKSGSFLTPGSGMGKKSGSGSGMNNQDHFERVKTIFWVKIFKFFDMDADPECKKIESGIRDKHPGSATLRTNYGTSR
jgi:hypothetical protein